MILNKNLNYFIFKKIKKIEAVNNTTLVKHEKHFTKVFSCSQDETIKIWSLETNECIQTLKGHELTVNCVTILPNGNLLSFSDDRKYKIWDLDKSECIKTMEVDGFVLSLKILSNSRLATGSFHEIKIWSLNDMECIKSINTHTKSDSKCDRPFISGFVEMPNGNLITSCYDKMIKVWNLNEGKCLKSIVGHNDQINYIILLKNGQLATCSDDKTIKIWDMEQLKCVQTLKGHTSSVLCIDETSKEHIVSGCNFGTIKVWNLNNRSRNCIKTIIVNNYEGIKAIECIKYYKNDLIVCGGDNRRVQIWNISTGNCVHNLLGHSDYICYLLLA